MANVVTLKEREQEILRHLSNGMSSKQIARQINISPNSRCCRRQIMNKLRIDSIAGLVKFAICEGLTTLMASPGTGLADRSGTRVVILPMRSGPHSGGRSKRLVNPPFIEVDANCGL